MAGIDDRMDRKHKREPAPQIPDSNVAAEIAEQAMAVALSQFGGDSDAQTKLNVAKADEPLGEPR
jgi:hypothetical protein